MPYIDKKSRKDIDEHGRAPITAGELNYVFCKIMLADNSDIDAIQWVIKRYLINVGTCYQSMNDVMGALTGAYEELRRRTNQSCKILINAEADFYDTVVAPYEDKKILENGDVFSVLVNYGVDSAQGQDYSVSSADVITDYGVGLKYGWNPGS